MVLLVDLFPQTKSLKCCTLLSLLFNVAALRIIQRRYCSSSKDIPWDTYCILSKTVFCQFYSVVYILYLITDNVL